MPLTGGVAGYREPIEAAGHDDDRIDMGDPAFASFGLREHDLLIMIGGPMEAEVHAVSPHRSPSHR